MNQQPEQPESGADDDLDPSTLDNAAEETETGEFLPKDADNPPPEEAEEPVELTLEQQLEAALAEADQLRDSALRAVAEQENMRRRTQRDVQNARKYGSESLLRKLVEVVDSLESALASDDPDGEGVKLTLDLLLKIFEQNQVVILSPVGELFNPDLHQAMTMQPSEEVPHNHVLQVIQKGYQLHDRLLRPAMVIVAKGSENEAAIEPGE